MSRLDELKKQYPEFNITVLDLIKRMDSSKTYKYLPLICKLFSKRFNFKSQYRDDYQSVLLDMQSRLLNKNISTSDLSEDEMYFYHLLSEYMPDENFFTLKDFIHYMDRNQIENKDVTSYSSIDEMRGAVTLASIKEFSKEMENQIVKEYEDETWIAVRPLTFSASAKYGAGTRWCTTYQKEKNYFERYWRGGILCYFINKKTGYKFAGYKSLQDKEMSFWNANDSRMDYLDVEIDDYMFSKVKKIFSSEFSNKNLCSDAIQEQVHMECIDVYEKQLCEAIPMEEPAVVRNMTAVPVYDTPNVS